MIRQIIAAGVISASLGGCSGSSGSMPDTEPDTDSMSPAKDSASSSEPATGAASPGGAGAMTSAPVVVQPVSAIDPYIDSIASTGDELVFVPVTETSELSVTNDFLFDTARAVKVKLDIEEAFGKRGSLSLCTEYQVLQSDFAIDYNSCIVRAYISDGQFESDISLVNQHDSLIAVIWFPDQDMETLYHEFLLADLTSGVDGPVWLWN